jgi:hypothetical protein
VGISCKGLGKARIPLFNEVLSPKPESPTTKGSEK